MNNEERDAAYYVAQASEAAQLRLKVSQLTDELTQLKGLVLLACPELLFWNTVSMQWELADGQENVSDERPDGEDLTQDEGDTVGECGLEGACCGDMNGCHKTGGGTFGLAGDGRRTPSIDRQDHINHPNSNSAKILKENHFEGKCPTCGQPSYYNTRPPTIPCHISLTDLSPIFLRLSSQYTNSELNSYYIVQQLWEQALHIYQWGQNVL